MKAFRSTLKVRSWPLVTFSSFEEFASPVLEETGATYVGVSILLTNTSNRTEYEEYAISEVDWIDDSLSFVDPSGRMFRDQNITQLYKSIQCSKDDRFTELEACPDKEIYAPIRQVAPIAEGYPLLGVDALTNSYFKNAFDAVAASNETILSDVMNLDIDPSLHDDETYWPASLMAVPIIRYSGKGKPNWSDPKYENITEAERSAVYKAWREKQTRELKGLMTAQIPWHNYFTNLIPEGIDGIYLVVRNTLDQEFTYLINGPDVVFLGTGNFHEPKFDQYGRSADFTTVKSIPNCNFTIHLYPSQLFADEYITDGPIVNAISILFCFLLCVAVFLVYDVLVERRKNHLMSTATKTGLLVNSLFPKSVVDRLLEDAKKTTDKKKASEHVSAALKSLSTASSVTSATTSSLNPHGKGKPIADIFASASVLFGE